MTPASTRILLLGAVMVALFLFLMGSSSDKPSKQTRQVQMPVPQLHTTQQPQMQAPVQATASDDANDWLAAHNSRRKAAKKNLPPLQWDDKLANDARAYARTLAQSGCGIQHDQNLQQLGQGENLYEGPTRISSPEQVLQGWHDSEKKFYNPDTGRCFGGACGHYTQVLWRGTTHVGCAFEQCANGKSVGVCRYSPAGNVTINGRTVRFDE